MHAVRIPSTGLTQSQAMQFAVEKTISSFPRWPLSFRRPVRPKSPPIRCRQAHPILSLFSSLGRSGRTRSCRKKRWSREIERAVKALPGNAYEFTQPIQMRFNELIAGVRGDIAVKVFGDEFDTLLRVANQIAAHPAGR